MDLLRSNHNAYLTHYHIVFPVKYRRALLKDEIPLAIGRIAGEIELRYDIKFEKIGYDKNHIHILVSFAPKYSGSVVEAYVREQRKTMTKVVQLPLFN